MRCHCMAALPLVAGVAPGSLRKAFLCLGQPSPGLTQNGLGLGDSWKLPRKEKHYSLQSQGVFNFNNPVMRKCILST